MSYTRKQWVLSFLKSIGNNNPSQEIVGWMNGWTVAESVCCNVAAYNLLNTTQDMQGATAYNHFGNGYSVKNYTSYEQGIQANTIAITNGYYPTIYNDLKTNNFNDLISNPSVVGELATWGTGGSGRSIYANSGNGLNDTFQGDSTGVVTQPMDNSISSGNPVASSLFSSYGEHIGLFLLSIVFVGLGIMLLVNRKK